MNGVAQAATHADLAHTSSPPGVKDTAAGQESRAYGTHEHQNGAAAISPPQSAAPLAAPAADATQSRSMPSKETVEPRTAVADTSKIVTEFGQPTSTGPARLEIGVLDSTHGWLKVRAEAASPGATNTVLVVSASAHEAMSAALPEIASYLNSEGVGVARIELHRASSSSSMEAPAAQTDTSRDENSRNQREGFDPREAQASNAARHGQFNTKDVLATSGPSFAGGQRLLTSPVIMLAAGVTGGWVNFRA